MFDLRYSYILCKVVDQEGSAAGRIGKLLLTEETPGTAQLVEFLVLPVYGPVVDTNSHDYPWILT